MQVEIWSDVACPWCAVGKHNLESALAGFEHAGEVTVRWRSFQLDPRAPAVDERAAGGYADRLADKYGTSRAQAQSMIDRITERGAEAGWAFDFETIRPGNTFDAHRVLHLAHERGVQDAVKERFLTAYFEEGAAIGDRDVLRRLAAEAGLADREVADVLAGDRYADAVRDDIEQARRLGIRGVPMFVIERQFGISGAQPPAVLRQALEQALEEHRPPTVVGAGPDHDHPPGETCHDGTCAV